MNFLILNPLFYKFLTTSNWKNHIHQWFPSGMEYIVQLGWCCISAAQILSQQFILPVIHIMAEWYGLKEENC